MRFRDSAPFFTVEKLSPHREKTPEGFLLCRDVPISRIGEFNYTPMETGIPGKGGKVVVSRTEEELFKPETMASFEGKPVVIGHSRFADPSNWREISIGHVQNVRRGEGDQNSLLLADLLLQDDKGIRLVQDGELTEVSCGYDARAVSDGDGKGHQVGIVGNHVALVQKARCGGICKIGDGFMTKKEPKSWKTALRRLFKDGDEDGFNEALDNINETEDAAPETSAPAAPAVPTADERFAALETAVKALSEQVAQLMPQKPTADGEGDADPKPEENDPETREVGDEEAAKCFGDAETVAPGLAKPQGDAADGKKYTAGLLNRQKRLALKTAGITAFGDAASLSGQALDIAFTAAVEMAKAKNNPTPTPFKDGTDPVSRPTNEELNNKFNSFWEGK